MLRTDLLWFKYLKYDEKLKKCSTIVLLQKTLITPQVSTQT
jgi:hypothetical protein